MGSQRVRHDWVTFIFTFFLNFEIAVHEQVNCLNISHLTFSSLLLLVMFSFHPLTPTFKRNFFPRFSLIIQSFVFYIYVLQSSVNLYILGRDPVLLSPYGNPASHLSISVPTTSSIFSHIFVICPNIWWSKIYFLFYFSKLNLAIYRLLILPEFVKFLKFFTKILTGLISNL